MEPTELRARALSGWAARFASASASAAHFAISELAFTTQVNLRGDRSDGAFSAGAMSVIGCLLPADANTYNGSAERGAIWLGPDEWLLTALDGDSEFLSHALRQALRGVHHSVVDLSASRAVIEISGRDARPVLAKGCALDLHASAFAPLQTAQTLLARSQVVLQCTEAACRFRLYVRNSFANYVAEWLTDAAAESAAARSLDSERLAAGFARPTFREIVHEQDHRVCRAQGADHGSGAS